MQEAARIPSGPRGTWLFPTTFLPEPGGPPRPSGDWEQKWPRFPGPRKGRGCGRALWCGRPARVSPPVPTARALGFRQGEGPGQKERVSRAGPEDGGRGRQSRAFHPWLPITPGKPTLHPQYRPQPLQPHASFHILHRARHPRAFAQSFLTLGYSSNSHFCTSPSLPLWATPSLKSDWVPIISSPTPLWSPGILAFSIIYAILTLPTGRLLKGKGNCPARGCTHITGMELAPDTQRWWEGREPPLTNPVASFHRP